MRFYFMFSEKQTSKTFFSEKREVSFYRLREKSQVTYFKKTFDFINNFM